MKQYRLIKPFLFPNGKLVEPQLLTAGVFNCWADNYGFSISFVESNTEYFEEVKPERWKSEKDEAYWFIDRLVEPILLESEIWDAGLFDNDHYSIGNCFQTKAQAEEAAKRVKQTLMDYQDELMEAGK